MDVVPEPPVRLCAEPPIEVVPEPLADEPLEERAGAGELGCCEATGADELEVLGLVEDTGVVAVVLDALDEAEAALALVGDARGAALCLRGARRCAA